MNGDSIIKYLHWIVIGVIIIVAVIVSPHLLGDLFHTIMDMFSSLFDVTKNIGKDAQGIIPAPIK